MAAYTALITRPEPDASTLENTLKDLGYTCLKAPLLNIVYKPSLDYDLDNYDHILITSRRAVEYLKQFGIDAFRKRSFLCVGEETAKILKISGAEIVKYASNINLLQSQLPKSSTLYLRGQHITKNLSETHTYIDEDIVYEAHENHFSEEIQKSLKIQKSPIIAPLFSKRTAMIFLKEIKTLSDHDIAGRLKILCISTEVLNCVNHMPWSGLETSTLPTYRAMLERMYTYI